MPAEVASIGNSPRKSPWAGVIALWAGAVLAFVVYLGIGSSDPGKPFEIRLSPAQVVRELFAGDRGPGAGSDNVIVWRVRLLRGLACLLVGALLGMVGSAFQALFRNPLAEPYVVGVSSGAAVGGALSMAFGLAAWGAGLGLMACAFAGGAASLGLVLSLAGRRGRTDVQILLLAGVVISALLSALLYVVLFAAGLNANDVLRWMLGMTTPMFWNRILAMTVALALGAAVLIPQGKKLNTLAMSEETAQRLGVDTARLKTTLLLTGTAMAAVAVGSVGVIGFLGLVAPHIARKVLGVDWRWSLIGAGAIGAILLIFADILAQRLIPGAEMPVGVVTAILGAPFLLVLMRRPES